MIRRAWTLQVSMGQYKPLNNFGANIWKGLHVYRETPFLSKCWRSHSCTVRNMMHHLSLETSLQKEGDTWIYLLRENLLGHACSWRAFYVRLKYILEWSLTWIKNYFPRVISHSCWYLCSHSYRSVWMISSKDKN